MPAPAHPKLYHIVHVDRLPSIINDGHLWCDAEIIRRKAPGTAIGMNKIKQRRLSLPLESYPDLCVGDCVPFYFCPRSVMLYALSRRNHPEIAYREGQELIMHLVADLHASVAWANSNNRRWAFTLSNAGSSYFEDRNDLRQLHEIDWDAVQARDWRLCREAKQAEFLMEQGFPWHLIELIGVHSEPAYQRAVNSLPRRVGHRPRVEIKRAWYY